MEKIEYDKVLKIKAAEDAKLEAERLAKIAAEAEVVAQKAAASTKTKKAKAAPKKEKVEVKAKP